MSEYELTINVNNLDGGASDEEQSPEKQKGGGVFSTLGKIWSGSALARQALSTATSAVSQDRGNALIAQRTNSVMSMAGKALGVASAFAINPIIGAATVANIGIGLIGEVATYDINVRWESIQRQELLRRAGAEFNRSRGANGI